MLLDLYEKEKQLIRHNRRAKFEYREFIESRYWEAQKLVWYSRHKKICARCKSGKNINLHHKRYSKNGRYLSLTDQRQEAARAGTGPSLADPCEALLRLGARSAQLRSDRLPLLGVRDHLAAPSRVTATMSREASEPRGLKRLRIIALAPLKRSIYRDSGSDLDLYQRLCRSQGNEFSTFWLDQLTVGDEAVFASHRRLRRAP